MGDEVTRRALVVLVAALPLWVAGCHRSSGPKATAVTAAAAGATAPGPAAAAKGASGAGAAGSAKAPGAAPAPEPKLADLSVDAFRAALPTVNPAGLDGHQRAVLVRVTQDVLCECGGKPTTLAGSLAAASPCLLAQRMVQLAGTMAASGLSVLEAANALEQYYGGFAPQARAIVMVDPKSCEGPTEAPVTLVEFADFQCPHCKHAFPLIHKVVAHYKGKVRWCYLNFPLPMHPEAREAAELAEMAKTKGKFFEMAGLLFEHQDTLSRSELLELGKKVGLEPAAVTAALDGRNYEPIVKKQFMEARRLHLDSTPTLFIDGRKLTLPVELLPWAIDDELLFQSHGNSWNG